MITFAKVEDANYISVTDEQGKESILPRSFIVKAGENGFLKIGSERQLYGTIETEVTTVHYSEVQSTGLKEGEEEQVVLYFLAKLFLGSVQRLDIYTDVRVANLIALATGEIRLEEFLETLTKY